MNKKQRQRTKAGKYPCKTNVQIWNVYSVIAEYIYGALSQYKHDKDFASDDSLDRIIWAFNEIRLDYPHTPSILKEIEFERQYPDYFDFDFVKLPDGMYTIKHKHQELIDQLDKQIDYKEDKIYHKQIEQGIAYFVQMLYAKSFEAALNRHK